MKKIFFLISILFLNSVVFASEIEFSVCSGVKIKTDSSVKKAKVLTPSIKRFYDLISQLNASKTDFNIFLGDNISGADKYNLVMFSKMLKNINAPIYVTYGENDLSTTKKLGKKEYFHILNLFSKNKISKLPTPSVAPKFKTATEPTVISTVAPSGIFTWYAVVLLERMLCSPSTVAYTTVFPDTA